MKTFIILFLISVVAQFSFAKNKQGRSPAEAPAAQTFNIDNSPAYSTCHEISIPPASSFAQGLSDARSQLCAETPSIVSLADRQFLICCEKPMRRLRDY